MASEMLLYDKSESSSTPKLSLSMHNPPRTKVRGGSPIQMKTPPLHPSLSVPFEWEIAPGKPRATSLNKRLNMPLLNDDHLTNKMPSPTTVLDGPYVGCSLSLSCTFSFRKGPTMSKKKCKDFGSWRFESFGEENVGKFDVGNFGCSHTLGAFFKSEENFKGMRRARRKGRYFNLSRWVDMYTTFKEAVIGGAKAR